MKLTVIGLGYIGLPTSIMFASHGVDVVGVDIAEDAVNKLNSGKIHIEEPGLQEALEVVLDRKVFKASLRPEKADVFIIAVPTPNLNDEYKSCDLSSVISGVKSILPLLEKGNTIIVESTIGPRSMNDEIKPLVEQAGFVIGTDIFLVHCPERVLPGQIMYELTHNNRIVGGITPQCTEAGERIYRTFVEGEIILTDAKTAEMSKLMENTFRDVNIALANELVQVCNELDINALSVIEMANKHPRVNLHQPGPGVGGHCLAVDPHFIVSKAPQQAKMISLARETNNSMPEFIVDNVKRLLGNDKKKIITIFGLTYKGNVDDIRESPAMDIRRILETETNFEVRCYDPHVLKPFVEADINIALKDSSLILILSDHNEFKDMKNFPLNLMNKQMILDTKNIVNESNDFLEYINLGNLYKFNKIKTSSSV